LSRIEEGSDGMVKSFLPPAVTEENQDTVNPRSIIQDDCSQAAMSAPPAQAVPEQGRTPDADAEADTQKANTAEDPMMAQSELLAANVLVCFDSSNLQFLIPTDRIDTWEESSPHSTTPLTKANKNFRDFSTF
jgi:hypothetical protein